MNLEKLNIIIEYIEKNITEKIDYNTLAKMIGTSEYTLQRIFSFLTNITLSEYIRKRRLSKAYEELKNSNIKIIDLAIKYQYDSSISFIRAFKNMFGMTPTECRKNYDEYKIFPIINFSDDSCLLKEVDYHIEFLEPFSVYALGVNAENLEDLYFKIRELYKKIRENGLRLKFDKVGMYGISLDSVECYSYYVGCKEMFENSIEIKIPRGKYVVFKVDEINQKSVLNVENMIYNQWDKSTYINIVKNFIFELYKDDCIYLYVLIENKQN